MKRKITSKLYEWKNMSDGRMRLLIYGARQVGKTFEMNLEAMNHLELFQNLGFPVLLGTSRKSMIGLALELPVDQRVEEPLATSVIGVMKGWSFVRVHDVKENKRVIQMTEAILGRR